MSLQRECTPGCSLQPTCYLYVVAGCSVGHWMMIGSNHNALEHPASCAVRVTLRSPGTAHRSSVS
jgi:hypothetical protein